MGVSNFIIFQHYISKSIITWINSIVRLSEFEFKLLLCSAIKFLITANESYHAYKIDNFNSTKIWILILFSRVFLVEIRLFAKFNFSWIETYPPKSSDFNLKFISAWKPKMSDRKFAWAFMKKSNHHTSISRDHIFNITWYNSHGVTFKWSRDRSCIISF